MDGPLKTCSKCGIEKNRDGFSRDQKRTDGLDTRCKECRRAYHQENKARRNRRRQSLYQENRAREILKNARARARRKSLEFDLTKDWIQGRLDAVCELTGKPFDLELSTKYKVSPYTPSIDRIDSRKGYTKDNCQVICWFVNQTKSEYTDQDFRSFCETLGELGRTHPVIREASELLNGAGVI